MEAASGCLQTADVPYLLRLWSFSGSEADAMSQMPRRLFLQCRVHEYLSRGRSLRSVPPSCRLDVSSRFFLQLTRGRRISINMSQTLSGSNRSVRSTPSDVNKDASLEAKAWTKDLPYAHAQAKFYNTW